MVQPGNTLAAASDRLENPVSIWKSAGSDFAAIVARQYFRDREELKLPKTHPLDGAMTSSAAERDALTIPDPPLDVIVEGIEGFACRIPVVEHSVIEIAAVGKILTLLVHSPPSHLQWLVGAHLRVVPRD